MTNPPALRQPGSSAAGTLDIPGWVREDGRSDLRPMPEDLGFSLERSGVAGSLIAEEARGVIDLLSIVETGPESEELHRHLGDCFARLAVTLLRTSERAGA